MPVTEQELVEGILAVPDDDAPRMVYADWLIDRGDPRGELVVAQCALERAVADDRPLADTQPLRERVRALIDAHGAAWLDPLFAITAGYYEFRRGLVEHVELMQSFVEAEPVHELAPLLRSIAGTHELAPAMFAAAGVLSIEELQFVGVTDLASVRRGCLAIDSLRRLDLRRVRAELDAEHIAFGGGLAHLGLDLIAPIPGQVVLERLVHSHDKLRSLALRNVIVDNLAPLATVELTALELGNLNVAAWPVLPKLASLTLSQCTIGELDRLFEALPALRHLRLVNARLPDRAAIALAESPHAARLTRLDLTRNDIGSEGARALADSPHLQGLVELRLAFSNLNDAAKQHLRAALPHAEVVT